MHKEITANDISPFQGENIYDMSRAKEIYDRNPGLETARNLVTMKQQNIMDAINEIIDGNNNYTIKDIQMTLEKRCGMCFYSEKKSSHDGIHRCGICPIKKKVGKECWLVTEYDSMFKVIEIRALKLAHEKWCKAIGFDVYGKHKLKTWEVLIDRNSDYFEVEAANEGEAEEKAIKKFKETHTEDYGWEVSEVRVEK